jgi:hypothetical protein
METLIVKKGKKEDIMLLMNIAQKMGMEVLKLPKKTTPEKETQ